MEELNKIRQQGIRILCGVAWLSTLIVLAGSFFADSGFVPVLLAGALVIYPTLAAARKVDDAVTRIAVGATMPVYSAILLFQWSGHSWLIDLHMTFFAMIATLAVLADWRPVLAGAAVTAVHHLALNFLAPSLVFSDGADFGRVVLHAVVVIAETGVLIVLARRLETMLLAQVTAQQEKSELEHAAGLERIDREREQQFVVREIEKGLRSLAAGDLDCPIESRFPAAFEPLRSDFNATLDALNTLIANVADASSQIRNGTQEIRIAADDLARRTEMEAASVEQATHTIGTLVSSAAATAAQASKANDTLSSSQDRAAKGHAVVGRAMETMHRIEQSAGEIAQIISLIDGIAFQTNLLALNAGVEAARAGDAGKGFAVVANEVRALAQRSADAAKSIETLITASTAQVSEGVELVTQTGHLLQEVVTEVTSIGSLVTDIASAARFNADSLSDVRETFNGLDRSTQQNAAMVEQSNAALRTLAHETDALMTVVERFKGKVINPALQRAA